MKLSLVLMVVASCVFESESVKSYKNHKVVSFRIENEAQLKEIQELQSMSGFTFWDPPVQVDMKLELVISPESFAMFEEIATTFNISYEITSDDLQSWIDDERPLKQSKAFGFDKYNTYEEINEFLDSMVAAYPEKVTVFTIGYSYEGRPLRVAKITSNSRNKAIFIEANIHAREWIASATAVWLINEIASGVSEHREVLDSVTWYILPVMNADGYKYSMDENRLWRKTRSVHNILCRGVDANRNFGFNWRMGGSSALACDDTYAGPTAFSEPEAQAVVDFYEMIAEESDAYIAFHCATQALLYPMGHDRSEALVPNVEHLKLIGQAAVDALTATHGTEYLFGNVIEVLYVASGSSPDHAYGTFNTPIAFTYEFRAGSGTPSRFILPPEEIIPNSEEIRNSLVALIVKAKELGYFQERF